MSSVCRPKARAGPADPHLEVVGVHIVTGDREEISGRMRFDDLAAVAEPGPESRDQGLQRVGRSVRGLVVPETVDEPLRRDHPAGFEGEEGQQSTQPGPPTSTGRPAARTSKGPSIRIRTRRFSPGSGVFGEEVRPSGTGP
jgi:hypothetical protein